MTVWLRNSILYVIDHLPPNTVCTAAEIGVCTAEHVSTWVSPINGEGKYLHFKEIVLVDSTKDLGWLKDIDLFTRRCPYSKFINCLSVEAASMFKDEYFDFIYVDATHNYTAVLEDLNAWQYKVKKNGFICGHDYNTHEEVTAGVDEFARSKNTKVVKFPTEFCIERTW